MMLLRIGYWSYIVEKIDNLETIISLAKEQITESYKINFNLNVEFDIDVIKNSIEDKEELAQDFQNPVCPNNLYINHGTYIHRNKDGIKNVINDFKTGTLTQKLYDTLTGIQWGKLEDKYHWTKMVK